MHPTLSTLPKASHNPKCWQQNRFCSRLEAAPMSALCLHYAKFFQPIFKFTTTFWRCVARPADIGSRDEHLVGTYNAHMEAFTITEISFCL